MEFPNVEFFSLTFALAMHLYFASIFKEQGLNRNGHMSFLTGQDRTPKFARQVLPDRTKSGLIFLNILHTKYELSILLR